MVELRAVALVLSVALAALHVFAGKLTFLDRIPRSRWLSFAGGTSVAYVFVHLLPEIEAAGEAIEPATGPWLAFLDHHPAVMALAGFVLFYGLERLAKRSGASGTTRTERRVFRVHVASFTGYNAIIGYLLVSRYAEALGGLAIFAVAIGLHFVVNDYGLRQHHGDRYHRRGRWVIAVAVVAGSLLALAVPFGEPVVLPMLAFLAGSVVLNVIKEELPEERESRFPAFAAGAGGYAVVLVLL